MQRVIDSHFHIWRQQDLPWLVGPRFRAYSDPTSRSGAIIRSKNFSPIREVLGSRKPFMSRLTGPKTASKRRLHGFRKRRTRPDGPMRSWASPT